MRLVSSGMLTSDMVLAKSIYHGNCLLLSKGQRDLERFKVKLNRLGIGYLYVEDESSKDIEIPDVVTEETRLNCKVALQNTLEEFSRYSTSDLSELKESVQSLLDEVLQNSDVLLNLNDISIIDEYTFTHSVSVAVYSLLTAKSIGMDRNNMEKLAIGAILHDVGKTVINKNILFKKGKLTQEEFQYVQQHTILGYQLLQNCSSLTELSKIVALTHHERLDGSGYPYGRRKEELHLFSRISAIADVYDALTTDRCYRGRWPANKAVDYLIECSDQQFDNELVAALIHQIAIYPNGSLIRLSSGSIGLVKEQNKGMPLRPVVRVLFDKKGNKIPLEEIDLMKELSLTIVESDIEIKRRI